MSDTEATKHDSEKPRVELIAPIMLIGLGRVLGFGARKYAAWNWAKGMAWSRPYGALLRHVIAWAGGEDLDPESGEHHLDHAACELMFMRAYAEHKIGTDDRWKAGKVGTK